MLDRMIIAILIVSLMVVSLIFGSDISYLKKVNSDQNAKLARFCTHNTLQAENHIRGSIYIPHLSCTLT